MLMPAPARAWEGIAVGVLGSLSLTWGGAGDIIVPVTDDGPHPAFQSVVRAFDPDWISIYRVTQADMPGEGDGRLWFVELPDDHLEMVSGWCSPFPSTDGFWPPASRGEAVHQPLVPLTAFPEAWQQQVIDLDLSEVDQLLALMVTMRIGTLGDAVDLPGPSLRRLPANEADIPALSELAVTGAPRVRSSAPDSQVRHMSGLHAGPHIPLIQGISPLQPLQRTSHGMSRLRPIQARPEPWIIVIGDTCADFCFALACDRLVGGATWLPLPRIPDTVLDAAFPALSAHITNAVAESGRQVPVTSLSLDPGAIEQARERLRRRGGEAFTDKRTTVLPASELSFSYPARLGDSAHVTLAETSAVHRDSTDGSLRVDSALLTPVPEVVRRAADGQVTWQVDVRVEGEQPPARPVLGPTNLLAATDPVENLQIRSGAENLAYHSRSAMVIFAGSTLEMSLARPRLRLPAAHEILRMLAQAAGYDIRPSQTGRLNATLAGLWGGISQAAADLGGPAWPLLRAMIPVSDEEDGNKDGRLVIHGQPYVTFTQAADLMNVPAPQTREIMDRFIRHKIMRRGLVLRCGRCNWLDWYPLEVLGQEFCCSRCTQISMIEQQLWRDPPEEPTWYYDLDHAVREALRFNGHVPILAADRLSRDYPAFSVMHDFELVRPGASKPTSEIDLGAIASGSVILVEAKSANTLAGTDHAEKRDTAKLITAARALTADILCLATSQAEWSYRTRATVEEWTVPASVDTRLSCPIRRESEKWVRHAAHIRRSTRRIR